MKKNAVIILLSLLVAGGAFSQTSAFLPFVSRLTALSGDSGVLLSWQDTDEAAGDYFVYRHTEEITDSNLDATELLEIVAAGVKKYLDRPQNQGPHYYAVLASDASGSVYRVFVTYRNKTTRGVRSRPVIVAANGLAPVYGVTARIAEKIVIIDYQANIGEDIVIYRSTDPIVRQDSLLNAVLVETMAAVSAPYSDRPLPGVPYYYGVFYHEELRTGRASFEQGKNILISPVTIPFEFEETNQAGTTGTAGTTSTRVRPLPFLMLSHKVDSGEQLKAGPYEASVEAGPLDPQTEKAVNRLLDGETRHLYGAKDPVWLAEDDGDGPFYTLLEPLVKDRHWEAALAGLDTFMRTRRTAEETQKAYFYKGQCHYFLGQYEQSFVHFIFAEDSYYPEVQPWLDDLIALLASL